MILQPIKLYCIDLNRLIDSIVLYARSPSSLTPDKGQYLSMGSAPNRLKKGFSLQLSPFWLLQ